MKTDDPKKIVIKVATQEQHVNKKDNLRNQRKTLKTLQESAYDKENKHSRAFAEKDKNLSDDKRKKTHQLHNKSTQTCEATITPDDLTSDEPSVDYWKTLAEKRGDALNESLQENERLKEQVESLTEENRICKEMLEESRTLVEVLQVHQLMPAIVQEMLGEADTSTEIAQEATEEV